MKKHFTSYIFIASLGVVFNAPFCLSQTSIVLNNGAELSYQTGDVDLSDYSGELSEITYYSPDGEILTAENVLVQTNKNTQDGHSKNKNSSNEELIYKLVEINKFEISSEREPYNLSANLIELRDFPHSLITRLFEKGEDTYVNENFLTNFEWDIRKISPKLKLLAVDFKLNGIFLETENIKADIYPVSDKSAKAPYLLNFELIIENSNLTPIGDSEIAASLASTLSDLDLQKLSLSLFAKSQLSQINDIQHAKFDIRLIANQLFGATIYLYMEYPVLENTLEVEKTELAMKLLPQVKLHKIEIELEDFGLNSRLSNPRLNDYHSAAENLRNFLVANMPANGKRLSIPITKFAYNGGKLSLLLHPRTPKPIALIASMLLFPDLIVEEFAISSAHHP